MKQYKNESQPTFPLEDCGCEACIGERAAIKDGCTCWCHKGRLNNGSGMIMCGHCHPEGAKETK